MANLKKYPVVLKQFVLFLTFLSVISCGQQKFNVTEIKGRNIKITEKNIEAPEIEKFIKPYREHIDKDLNNVLCYNPETLDKSDGKWQTKIGSLMADITLEEGNPVFESREHKSIDICLLNHGGIRAIIPKGDVTNRTAFEIMPFENSLFVAGIKGDKIIEMVNYLIAFKKPHPLAGMKIVLNKDETAYTSITIQGKPLDMNKTYYIATSDYLINGGDNMNFFKGGESYDMNYKLRNILIDYFKKKDSLPVTFDERISIEK